MILMVRADDRLIHGMVAVSWTSYLQPQTILVANDEAAKDSFKSMTMKMAKPAGVNLVIKDLDASVRALNNPVNDRKKIFLVTQSVEDALYIFERVKGITKLNIGTAGVNKKQDETYIPTLAQVYMTQREYDCAKKMADQGTEVFAQITPTLERMYFRDIEKIFNK